MIPVPQAVLDGLAAKYGVEAKRLAHFGGGDESSDGVVYAYPYADSQRLLKIMAISVEEQRIGLLCFEERLKFMRYLGENGANIVFPQRSPDGNLYETHLGESHLWVGYSMRKAAGKTNPEKAWDLDFFRNWGQVIGKNHRLAKEYPSWRSVVDPETGKDLLTWQGEWQGFYNWCQDEEVKVKWGEIREELEKLPVERDSFGFIHNDPHNWNLLRDGEEITLLDFDVANHHWFMTDISIACQNILIFLSGGLNGPVFNRGRLLGFLNAFMAGYRRENDLPAEWLNRLDLFIAYRRILMFIVMNEWVRSQRGLYKRWKGLILSPPEVAGGWA